MRRVVTGTDANGSSYVVSDEKIGAGETDGFVIWNGDPKDVAESVGKISSDLVQTSEPPLHGSRFRYLRCEPSDELRVIGARDPLSSGFPEDGYHVTRTIDYGYVLSGEIVLDLDKESVLLKAGDVVVQLATNHAWRTKLGVEVLFVLVCARAV